MLYAIVMLSNGEWKSNDMLWNSNTIVKNAKAYSYETEMLYNACML